MPEATDPTGQPFISRELRPDLPQEIEDLLLHMLAKNPDERFARAGEDEREFGEWHLVAAAGTRG